ncbi:MAG: hypothetical protein ACOVJ8_04735 [Sediminibacterium sp.]|jgi:hypothetical protein
MTTKNCIINGLKVLALSFFITSCSDDDESNNSTSNLTLNIQKLENLGTNYRYEGWLMVNGNPISTGTFTVNASGVLSQTSFPVAKSTLSLAAKFVLTIEPYPDTNAAPSNTKILAGDFSSNAASLTIGAPEALGTNFTAATGKYVLATPSDGMNNNEKSGIWFLGALPPTAGLSLPTLPTGWKYEGWVVINNTPVSTGTFTNAAAADAFSGYSGTMGVPAFPGEDFVLNAPMGLTFPTDLSGGKAVISVEPFPDNSPMPFLLKPLATDIPAMAMDHTIYNMSNNAVTTNPTGTASR